jgi:hypothetical protein
LKSKLDEFVGGEVAAKDMFVLDGGGGHLGPEARFPRDCLDHVGVFGLEERLGAGPAVQPVEFVERANDHHRWLGIHVVLRLERSDSPFEDDHRRRRCGTIDLDRWFDRDLELRSNVQAVLVDPLELGIDHPERRHAGQEHAEVDVDSLERRHELGRHFRAV